MAKLVSASPAEGLCPLTHGAMTLDEIVGPIWAIAPYRGKTKALSKALKATHGVGFPAPGGAGQSGDVRIVWSGLDQAFLLGAVPEPGLAKRAALTDQSDAWTHLRLEGPGAEAVLARLVPVDLSEAALPEGRALRSSLGHMAALILRSGGETFEILVFRSMAGTAVHELDRAMRTIVARAAMQG